MLSTPGSLLERLHDPRDKEAKQRLVEYCSEFIYHWVYKRFHIPHQDALDLVQEVFVTLFEKLPGLERDPKRRFRGWLFTIVRNKAIDWFRKNKQAPAAAVQLTNMQAPDEITHREEQEFNQQLVRQALEVLARDFEPNSFQAFRLLTIEGRTAADVARLLNMNLSTVYQIKSRGLRRLRQELAGLLD